MLWILFDWDWDWDCDCDFDFDSLFSMTSVLYLTELSSIKSRKEFCLICYNIIYVNSVIIIYTILFKLKIQIFKYTPHFHF